MKHRMEKEDKLVSDIMKEYQMVNPSEGFTDRVMQNIAMESSISRIKSSPLISKRGWIGVAASLLLLIVYLYFGNNTQTPDESGWLTQFFSSLSIPTVEFTTSDIFSRINFDSPTLFWICAGIVGIAFLALLERILELLNNRHLYLL